MRQETVWPDKVRQRYSLGLALPSTPPNYKSSPSMNGYITNSMNGIKDHQNKDGSKGFLKEQRLEFIRDLLSKDRQTVKMLVGLLTGYCILKWHSISSFDVPL